MSKVFKNLVSLFLIGTVSTSVFASNSYVDDDIFNESPRGKDIQIVLGLADAYVAYLLINSISKPNGLLEAESELGEARELMTDTEKSEKLIFLRKNLDMVRSENLGVHNLAKIQNEINSLIRDTSIVTKEFKTAKIADASKKVDFERALLLTSEAKYQKIIKGVKIVGAGLLILDVLGRIYVWNTLDANPTFTPVGTAAWKTAKRMLSNN
jgi:hypothetical protein